MSSTLKALLFFLLWTTAKGKDEEILCVYMKSCVLPCDFTPGSDLQIQWTQRDRSRTVHSFRQGQSQDLDQYHKYRGRTFLFEEEMNKGNASLLLRDVTVEDQGRYLCWANDQVTYVNMKVFAPVSEVDMFSIREKLYCQAHEIYPKPSLKWTMNPEPSAEPQTSVHPSETGLFSVFSSVPLPTDPPYKYTCTVSTEHSTNKKMYKRTYEGTHMKKTERPFDFSPQFWVMIFLAAALLVCICYTECTKTNRFQVISSKFQAMWKEKTDAPGEPRADADADVDVPNPEEEHLGPNNSEEAETEKY